MLIMGDLGRRLTVLAMASAGGALTLALAAPGHGQSLEDIVAAAKKEGEVRISITVREKEGNIVAAPRLIEAFQKKYPFLKVRYSRVGGSRERERIFTELVSGMVNFDVATLAQTQIPDGLRAKIFRKVDWRKLGAESTRTHPDGIGVNFRTQLYGISYNVNKISKDEAGKLTWESCADPRYRGQVVYDVRPRHLEILYQHDAWGEKATLDHVRRIKGNTPRFESDRTGMETRLENGAYAFVCGQFWSTHQRAVVGEGAKNIGFVAPEPALVSAGDLVFIPNGAKNPHAGMLWILWSISDEGQGLLDQVQFTGDPTVPGTSAHPFLKDKKVVRGRWDYQVRSSEILRSILSVMGIPVAR